MKAENHTPMHPMGSPERINVTRTFLPPHSEYYAHLEEVLHSRQLTNNGPKVLQLEANLMDRFEVEHFFALTNGTLALQIAIRALELKGEVLTTPFSYIATASSLVWEHCTPVFCDVEVDGYHVDLQRMEEAVTPRTTAVMLTHCFGWPCDVEAVRNLAERKGLKVIYDAAHAFGSKWKGESLFHFGDLSATSFHATKLFQTGEGGGIACNSDELATRIKRLRNFGHAGVDDFDGLGLNAKMSEIHAAMGLTIWPYVDQILMRYRQAVIRYTNRLEHAPVRLLDPANQDWNAAYFPVLFESELVCLNVKSSLEAQGVYPRRYFSPALNTLPFLNPRACPQAEAVASKVLCLPLFYELRDDQIDAIADVVLNSLTIHQ